MLLQAPVVYTCSLISSWQLRRSIRPPCVTETITYQDFIRFDQISMQTGHVSPGLLCSPLSTKQFYDYSTNHQSHSRRQEYDLTYNHESKVLTSFYYSLLLKPHALELMDVICADKCAFGRFALKYKTTYLHIDTLKNQRTISSFGRHFLSPSAYVSSRLPEIFFEKQS